MAQTPLINPDKYIVTTPEVNEEASLIDANKYLVDAPEPTPQKDFLQVIEEGLAEKPKLATFTPEEGIDIARVGLKLQQVFLN